ncbi:MAG TPA: hypothetical protein VEO95_05530 [Chthoniobacteraceae bacterium]|nr:hypothetical protein [Chthoniobacteraceae bacterium]
MTEHTHERGHRTTHARLFLVIVFVMQRLADAGVIWYTFLPAKSVFWLRGIALGSLVWTTALLIGVWRRFRWARYLLTSFTWVYLAVLTFHILQGWNELDLTLSDPYTALIAAAVLYLAANAILIRSRRVRHFANA